MKHPVETNVKTLVSFGSVTAGMLSILSLHVVGFWWVVKLSFHNHIKPYLCFVRFCFGSIDQSENWTLAKLFIIKLD